MNLAKRVRDCRYVKGWGPDELASRAEISRTALYQIECGKTELPRAGTIRRIAQALDMSVDQLLGEPRPQAPQLRAHVEEPDEQGLPDRGPDDRPAHADRDEDEPLPSLIRRAPTARDHELTGKFRELLASPFGEAIARIVLESHRMLLAGSADRGD